MRRIRVALAAAVAASVFGVVDGGSDADATGGGEVGKQVLDLLCSSKGGEVYFSPYAITRCEAARAGQGFRLEQFVCERLLGGDLLTAPTVGRPNRAGWACTPGSPSV